VASLSCASFCRSADAASNSLLSSSLFEAPCTHARDSEICSSTSASRHRSSSVSSSFGGTWGGECARQGQGQGQGRGAGAAGPRGGGGGRGVGCRLGAPTAPTPGGCARLRVFMLVEGVRAVRRGVAGHTWMRACHRTPSCCRRLVSGTASGASSARRCRTRSKKFK
jgi:hypothetical protein